MEGRKRGKDPDEDVNDGPPIGEAEDLAIMATLDRDLSPHQPPESKEYRRLMMEEQFPRLDGPVAQERVGMGPEEASRRIRERACELGADLVGFTDLDPRFVVRGRPIGGRWAVSVALAMDFDKIDTAPEPPSGIEVTRAYYQLGGIVVDLAEHIRSLGYGARAHHPRSLKGEIGSVLHKPLAHRAGLGEIGRNTLLITPEFGPRVRLATITTELEFMPGEPMDIGLASFCDTCNKCRGACPTGAIPGTRRKLSMTGHPGGEHRSLWRLDFERCLPFFVRTDGCAVCIKVCTFNRRPGKTADLVEGLLGPRIDRRCRKGE